MLQPHSQLTLVGDRVPLSTRDTRRAPAPTRWSRDRSFRRWRAIPASRRGVARRIAASVAPSTRGCRLDPDQPARIVSLRPMPPGRGHTGRGSSCARRCIDRPPQLRWPHALSSRRTASRPGRRTRGWQAGFAESRSTSNKTRRHPTRVRLGCSVRAPRRSRRPAPGRRVFPESIGVQTGALLDRDCILRSARRSPGQSSFA